MKVKLDIPDVLGDVLQSCRRNRGISSEDVVEMLGTSSLHHYSCIENNRSKPSYSVLVALVRYLGVDPRDFMYPEHRRPDPKRAQLIHGIEICSDECIEVLTAIWNGLPKELTAPKSSNNET